MTQLLLCAALIGWAFAAAAADPLAGLDAQLPELETFYRDLHQHPELSLQEEQTAAKLSARMREFGFELSERMGGHGIVAVLRHGNGPTVLVRTDMDALPIEELTGLAYASRVRAKNAAGDDVGVMHACGHDVHMTAWLGAAALLSRAKESWAGTLVFVGQPAEEVLSGAQSMIDAGLYERVPKPDFVLGLHVTQLLAAGEIGLVAGPASAASNAVDIVFYGKGGHGAMPHLAIDPVVMASRAVVAWQSIVSREVDPQQAAVITVGSFHAGTKRNIIPEAATLQLTVRSFSSDVQAQLLASIERIARAEASASKAPREPSIVIDASERSEVVINDPAMVARLATSMAKSLGPDRVITMQPFSSSEDFGVFGRVAGAPSVQLRIGASEAGQLERAKAGGEPVPGPHNAKFAPDARRTIQGGVEALVVGVTELLHTGAR